jgi:hypothetical protein
MALLSFGWDLPTNRGGLGGVGVCVVTLWTQSSMALDLLWTSIDDEYNQQFTLHGIAHQKRKLTRL